MSLPSSCRIGARNYTIHITPTDPVLDSNPDAHGYVDYPAGRIVIRESADVTFVHENLLHEILHALIDNSGLNSELQANISVERLLLVLAPRLHQFMRDNPGLLEEISRANA